MAFVSLGIGPGMAIGLSIGVAMDEKGKSG
jgi:hypothetical protein